MEELAHIQKVMANAIKKEIDLQHLSFIQQTPQLSVKERLHIYQTIRQEGMLSVLKEVYAVCCKLTGEVFFNQMTRLFTAETPAKSPDLGEYGEGFPHFIQGFEPAQSVPYLADIARLEWAWQFAFLADDAPSFNFSELAKFSPDNMVFKPVSSLSLIISDAPIEQIWSAHQAENITHALSQIRWQPESVIVWRHNGARYRRCLSQEEAHCLNKLIKGSDLETLSHQNSIENLPGWIDWGLIERVELKSKELSSPSLYT